MRKKEGLIRKFAVIVLVLVASIAIGQTALTPIPLKADYRVTKHFAVPGDGNWDYVNIDSAARRLYVSHGDLMQVLNADSGKLIGQIPAPGAHGVALVASEQRGFTSNGDDKSVTVFDTRTLKTIKSIKVDDGTDKIIYEPFSKRVFGLSEKLTAIDPSTNEIVGTVDLGGDAEGAVSDGKGTLYVSVPKQAAIAVVDPKALTVEKSLPTKPCDSPRTLEFDPAAQRLLIGCRDRFLVLDTNNGKVVAGSLQCSGVDASAYDAEDKLIFESCSEGVITVIRQMAESNYRTVATIPTQIWAKDMAYDPQTKNIYLPVADFEFVPNPKDPENRPNRIWKPGTFRVLVATKK